MNDNAARWTNLIDRFIAARNDVVVDSTTASERCKECIDEGAAMLVGLDAAGIDVLRDALADSERRWFVARIFYRSSRRDRVDEDTIRFSLDGPAVPAELADAMLRASVAEHYSDHVTMNDIRGFIVPTSLSVGYRHCAEFFIQVLDTADREMVEQVAEILFHLHPPVFRREFYGDPGSTIPVFSGDYRGEGLLNTREALRDALRTARERVGI